LRTVGDRFLDIQGILVYFSRMEEQQSTTSSTEPPGDRGCQSIRPEQIHQIILFRDEWEMSWGQIAAKPKLKRSTVQTADNRWEKHGVFKRKMGRSRSIDIHLPQSIVEKLLQDPRLSIRVDARVRDINRETVRDLLHKRVTIFMIQSLCLLWAPTQNSRKFNFVRNSLHAMILI
jgi:hypothetical protein